MEEHATTEMTDTHVTVLLALLERIAKQVTHCFGYYSYTTIIHEIPDIAFGIRPMCYGKI